MATVASSLRYRPDIDGLRAIAVVPVVFYHAGVSPFSGGFIGVDVFFVISGYLITTLINREITDDAFSILDFYQRRARRILPALYVVVGFCAICGCTFYTPDDLKRLGLTIIATAVFLSNVIFWLQSGYFGAQIDELPLLHTWSLAVEEQFYATFPLYCWLISKLKPLHRYAITLILCASSFALSAWSVRVFPSATFFLAPTRAWELLVGALLAIDFLPDITQVRFSFAIGFAGLIMIVAAALLYSGRTIFPGPAALVPGTGASCVIWAGRDAENPTSKLLSQRWLVFLGKISYSLYLWHFSLLAFASYLNVAKLSQLTTAIILALSLVVSALSWRLIEQPFRLRHSGRHSNLQFAVRAFAVTCVFCGVGFSMFRSGGFPARLTQADERILAESGDFDADRQDCAYYGPTVPRGGSCRLGKKSNNPPPQFALWGDSHAEAWRPAIDDMATRYSKAGVFVGRLACAPIIDVNRLDEPDCFRANQEIMRFILSNASINTVPAFSSLGFMGRGNTIQERRSEARECLSIAARRHSHWTRRKLNCVDLRPGKDDCDASRRWKRSVADWLGAGDWLSRAEIVVPAA